MLVEGGDEDQRRGLVLVLEQPAGHLEAGQAGHLDVEEHDVGLVPLDRVQRLDAVARLADDLDVPSSCSSW